MSTSLSFVLPAYNEAENIEAAVKQASRALAALVSAGLLVDWEVVVVDDGSSDRTAEVVSALYDPSVRLVQHSVNRGYGAALRTGFEAATMDLIFFTDADLQFDAMETIVLRIERYTLSRATVVPGRTPGFAGPTPRLGLALYGAFGLNVEDVNCAFKLAARCTRRAAY